MKHERRSHNARRGATYPITYDAARVGTEARDWLLLLKPRVISLVVFTGAAGLYMAPGPLNPLVAAVSILCVCMASGAAGAINMWYDRDIDAVMKRTVTRPIPNGRVSPDAALGYGIGLSVASVILMWLATNALAAGILAFSIFFMPSSTPCGSSVRHRRTS